MKILDVVKKTDEYAISSFIGYAFLMRKAMVYENNDCRIPKKGKVAAQFVEIDPETRKGILMLTVGDNKVTLEGVLEEGDVFKTKKGTRLNFKPIVSLCEDAPQMLKILFPDEE